MDTIVIFSEVQQLLGDFQAVIVTSLIAGGIKNAITRVPISPTTTFMKSISL